MFIQLKYTPMGIPCQLKNINSPRNYKNCGNMIMYSYEIKKRVATHYESLLNTFKNDRIISLQF